VARVYYLVARCYIIEGDSGRARSLLEDANRLDPTEPDYVYWIGIACKRLGNTACARAAWTQVLDIHPNHRGARKALDNLDPPQNHD